jgi:hypothetical protein
MDRAALFFLVGLFDELGFDSLTSLSEKKNQMESKIAAIQELLCKKASTKQHVFRITQDIFRDMKMAMRGLETGLSPALSKDAPFVEVRYIDKGDFEAHLKFGGDTLVMMMHTNIFDFEDAHRINHSDYMKEDPLREFCGMIQLYNFLSDSIKYNRDNDFGYLVARIFINKDKHFFVEGKRPLSFLYTDLEKNIVSEIALRTIIEEAMLFCLNFDLLAPPLENISYLSVEQKNLMSHSSGMPTGKRLGFIMSSDNNTQE